MGEINKAFGGNIPDGALQEWIATCDNDGDNEIDFGEFVRFRLDNEKKLKNGLNDFFKGL